MPDLASPPPVPNLNAALPRRATYFGRRSQNLISLLHARAADDALREVCRLEEQLSDRFGGWGEHDFRSKAFFAEVADAEDVLGRVRPLIAAGQFHMALTEVEGASFVRKLDHVQKAYDMAMGRTDAV